MNIRKRITTLAATTTLAGLATLSLTAPAHATAQHQTIAASNGWHGVYYSGQVQQRDNWCGPAAGATVLTNWRISGVPQSRLASNMKTNKWKFTDPWSLSGTLNGYIKAHLHWKNGPYRVYNNSPVSDMGNQKLWDLAVRDIKKGRALIILVQSRKIPWGGGGLGEGHYLVIVGYNTNYNGKAAYSVWDPAAGAVHSLAKNDFNKMAWGVPAYGRFVIA
ncbi:C39 family peptidase [Streptomyces sp. NPDC059340]|uniref:C39 family peptidase n=1 Tax=Streptomyces sp. NPDC059340 TaxID=3346806 RepID=UPI00367513FB